MTEQAGYYGKRRKWHSWGYEDEVISQAEVKEMAVRVGKRLGIDEPVVLSDPTLEEIELRESRISIPASLSSFCNSDKWDRVSHSYGKSFKDLTRIFRRDFTNPPDVIRLM